MKIRLLSVAREKPPPFRHLLSRPGDQCDSSPETRGVSSIRSIAPRFQSGSQGSPGEGKRFLLLLDPALIGLPELVCSAPGVRMLLATGCQKRVQRIALLLPQGLCRYCAEWESLAFLVERCF